MTRLFTGMTHLLAGVFGDRVTYLPRSGAPREIRSIFRESPITVAGADGQDLMIEAPTWRVARDLAPEVARGDGITLPDGRAFRVLVVHKNGSPSLDAFWICELHALATGVVP